MDLPHTNAGQFHLPQEALAQNVREVDIGHAEESRSILEGVAARLRESLAAKDAAVLAAPPALVRDLQVRLQMRAMKS